MALSAAQMQEAVIKNLPAKTGKSLDEWIRIAHDFNLSKNSDILKKLKLDYGLGHVQAQTIVWRMGDEKPYVQTEGYEERIFKINFELYKKLKNHILSISTTISVKPCKTYIPFYAKSQFAILTERKGELVLGLNVDDGIFMELQSASKLGGSNRINRMIVVEKRTIKELDKYLKHSFNINS